MSDMFNMARLCLLAVIAAASMQSCTTLDRIKQDTRDNTRRLDGIDKTMFETRLDAIRRG